MKKCLWVMAALIFPGIQQVIAGDMHEGMSKGQHDSAMHADMTDMKGAFLKQKQVDGYTVSFHIVKAPEGMQHGGSHHVMIKVEQQDEHVLGDIVVNSKVTHPNGESESKMMMKMGDWYMAAYDLGHPGPHQVMVLFKTTDGDKHFVGIDFPER